MENSESSTKVLLITPKTLTLDIYASVFAIAKVLKDQQNKIVHLASNEKLPDNFVRTFDLKDIKKFTSLPPKKFVLELPDQSNTVKSIQWQQENGKLSFFVTMEDGNLNFESVEKRISGGNYQSIIFVGVNNLGELGTLYSDNVDSFKEAKLVSIGGKLNSEMHDINLEIDEAHTSVSEDTFTFLTKMESQITEEIANALLAGIFNATENFTKNISSPKTYLICAELITKGGSNQKAQTINEFAKTPSTSEPLPQATPTPVVEEGEQKEEAPAEQITSETKPVNEQGGN